MKHIDVSHQIRNVAKQDFDSVKRSINRKQNVVVASTQGIKFHRHGDTIIATCSLTMDNDPNNVIEESISYQYDGDTIYSNKTISEVVSSILGSVITAADEDDAFGFDEFDEEDVEEDTVDADDEDLEEDVEEEFEDPESDPSIEVDNNIEGHYIVECDRCKGIFISALIESDEIVDHISGVCPLCEKESEQYIKWVVKPVEFGSTGSSSEY